MKYGTTSSSAAVSLEAGLRNLDRIQSAAPNPKNQIGASNSAKLAKADGKWSPSRSGNAIAPARKYARANKKTKIKPGTVFDLDMYQ
jgi:hypothetical protein